MSDIGSVRFAFRVTVTAGAQHLKTDITADSASSAEEIATMSMKYQGIDGIITGIDVVCGWFALCTNVATYEMPHPVLTSVPTCDRCAQRM